jgi:hypothetical protein
MMKRKQSVKLSINDLLGIVKIRVVDKWRRNLKPKYQKIVTLLTNIG